MTKPTSSPVPPRRARCTMAAAASAMLLLGACGTSGGSDGSATTTKAPAATSTTGVPTSTTTAAGDEDQPVSDDAPTGVMTPEFGDVLFATDFRDPANGGFTESPYLTFGATGLQVDVPDSTRLAITPVDETFADGIFVTGAFDLVNMEVAPDLVVGVACRSSSKGSYQAVVQPSATTSGGYDWAIYKAVEGAEPELLLDSDEPVSVDGASVPIGLVCLRTTAGEQLQILVGKEAPGVIVDTGELLNGSYVTILVEPPASGSQTSVSTFSVSRVTGKA